MPARCLGVAQGSSNWKRRPGQGLRSGLSRAEDLTDRACDYKSFWSIGPEGLVWEAQMPHSSLSLLFQDRDKIMGPLR